RRCSDGGVQHGLDPDSGEQRRRLQQQQQQQQRQQRRKGVAQPGPVEVSGDGDRHGVEGGSGCVAVAGVEGHGGGGACVTPGTHPGRRSRRPSTRGGEDGKRTASLAQLHGHGQDEAAAEGPPPAGRLAASSGRARPRPGLGRAGLRDSCPSQQQQQQQQRQQQRDEAEATPTSVAVKVGRVSSSRSTQLPGGRGAAAAPSQTAVAAATSAAAGAPRSPGQGAPAGRPKRQHPAQGQGPVQRVPAAAAAAALVGSVVAAPARSRVHPQQVPTQSTARPGAGQLRLSCNSYIAACLREDGGRRRTASNRASGSLPSPRAVGGVGSTNGSAGCSGSSDEEGEEGSDSDSDDGGYSDLEDFIVCQPESDYGQILKDRYRRG
ncbi:MAG: hypothetical protein WDW36_006613, partial [Sanguina aurantia]